MALTTMLDKMYAANKAASEARSAITQQMIAEALGAVIPEGYVLVWAQFTTYFNDGDACNFGVREPIIVEETDDLADITSPWGGDSDTWSDELGEAWSAVNDDTLLEAVFGDHKIIRVRRGGEFLVSPYTDHD